MREPQIPPAREYGFRRSKPQHVLRRRDQRVQQI